MAGRRFTIGTVLVAAAAATITMFPANAFADYAPTTSDVVGVGSDTLQQLGDFVADGDYTGNGGYNNGGNPNKFISIDATADANTRLAYGVNGLGVSNGTSLQCTPGTGGTVGTGSAGTTHTDTPCTLNPTVVLRGGFPPQQRPNGSGAGYNLLKQDTDSSGNGLGVVDFSRASSARVGTSGETRFDSVTVGADPLAMLSTPTPATHAVALSATQLNAIYSCTVTKWNDPAIGGSSNTTIIPLIPQVGSGTRSSFLTAITLAAPGACVQNVEENDPEAIGATSSPNDAIEPMSGGRLNLFLGKLSTGASNGAGGYFRDPSCPDSPAESAATPAACATTTAQTLVPSVKFWNSGTPTSGSLFDITRSLYIYFRDKDINSTIAFQPGNSLNWVRTMLYNPCSGVGHTVGCTTVGGVTYGPGGAPYVAQTAAQANISAAGITPAYAFTSQGP